MKQLPTRHLSWAGQIFHQRVLAIFLRETFNGAHDPIAELRIEVRRLKTERVECRVETSPLPGLGLCRQQQLSPSALPTLFGANPKIFDLEPSAPSPPVQARRDTVRLVALENGQQLSVVATCALDVVAVQTVEEKLDVRVRGLCFELQPMRCHGISPWGLPRLVTGSNCSLMCNGSRSSFMPLALRLLQISTGDKLRDICRAGERSALRTLLGPALAAHVGTVNEGVIELEGARPAGVPIGPHGVAALGGHLVDGMAQQLIAAPFRDHAAVGQADAGVPPIWARKVEHQAAVGDFGLLMQVALGDEPVNEPAGTNLREAYQLRKSGLPYEPERNRQALKRCAYERRQVDALDLVRVHCQVDLIDDHIERLPKLRTLNGNIHAVPLG